MDGVSPGTPMDGCEIAARSFRSVRVKDWHWGQVGSGRVARRDLKRRTVPVGWVVRRLVHPSGSSGVGNPSSQAAGRGSSEAFAAFRH